MLTSNAVRERESLVLEEPLERLLLTPARMAGIELPIIGVSVRPREPMVLMNGDRPWYFSSYVDDPTAREFGGFIPVPEVYHRRLVALVDAGVFADEVWIAHELPPGWREGSELPRLVPSDVRPSTVYVDGHRQAVQVFRRSGSAVASGLAGLRRMARELDPIVIAGVVDPSGQYVAWVELARWTW